MILLIICEFRESGGGEKILRVLHLRVYRAVWQFESKICLGETCVPRYGVRRLQSCSLLSLNNLK
jgi:hypothetical protein